MDVAEKPTTGKACGPAGVDVSVLLADDSLSPWMRERIQAADVNSDGVLSVSELMSVLESERRAQSDRKLFLQGLIALGLAVLILIAAVCGAVYGIVHLSQKVDDNDGVMVSASTGEVMSTGSVLTYQNVSDILSQDWGTAIAQVMEMDKLVVPDDDGNVAIYRVSTAELNKETGTVRFLTTDGGTLIVDEENVVILDRVATNGSSPGARRLLAANVNAYGGIIGVGSKSAVANGVPFATWGPPEMQHLIQCDVPRRIGCSPPNKLKIFYNEIYHHRFQMKVCPNGEISPDYIACGYGCYQGYFGFWGCESCMGGTPNLIPDNDGQTLFQLPGRDGIPIPASVDWKLARKLAVSHEHLRNMFYECGVDI